MWVPCSDALSGCNPLNQKFWAEVQTFRDVEWIATGPNGLIPFHLQNEFCAHLRWRMLDHCHQCCSIRARWRFWRWYQGYCVSCFMCCNLTSRTGYFQLTVPRYFPYEFKHHFRMTKRTFQIPSGNKLPLRAVNSQTKHLACEAVTDLL